jgi:hypothetical protein
MQRIVRDNETIGLMDDKHERLVQTYLNTRCLSKNGTDISFKRSNLANRTEVLTKNNSVGWGYYVQECTSETTFTEVGMEMKDGKIVISNLYRNTPFYYNSYLTNSIIKYVLEKNGNEIDWRDIEYASIIPMNSITNSTLTLYMENNNHHYLGYPYQYTGLLFTDSIYMSMTGGYAPPAPWHLQDFIISIGNNFHSYSDSISIEPTYDYSKLGPDNKDEYCKFYLIGNNIGYVGFGSDSCPEYGGINKIFNPNNSMFIYHENVLDYLNPSIHSYFTTSTHMRALSLNEPIFLHAKNIFVHYKTQTISFYNELNLLFELNDISELSGDSIESSLIFATTGYTNRDIKFRHGKTYVLLLTTTIPDIVSVNPDKKNPTFTLTNFFKTKNDKPITGKIQ